MKGRKTGGRQKGSKNKRFIFLPDMFDAKNLDWRTDIVRHLKRMPEYLRFQYYLQLLPYMVAKIEVQPYKPATPEQSAQNAKDAMELMRQMENDANPRRETDGHKNGMDNGSSAVQAIQAPTRD